MSTSEEYDFLSFLDIKYYAKSKNGALVKVCGIQESRVSNLTGTSKCCDK
jgi:hypothetical protein